MLLGPVSASLWGQQANGSTEPPDAGAGRVARTLEELETRHKDGTGAGRTYEMTEQDLNAYLKAQL